MRKSSCSYVKDISISTKKNTPLLSAASNSFFISGYILRDLQRLEAALLNESPGNGNAEAKGKLASANMSMEEYLIRIHDNIEKAHKLVKAINYRVSASKASDSLSKGED